MSLVAVESPHSVAVAIDRLIAAGYSGIGQTELLDRLDSLLQALIHESTATA